MILKIDADDQEYTLDLSNKIEELKEKADIYAKSDLTDEEKELLQQPAKEVIEDNYKIVIDWFNLEENKEWQTEFTYMEWYILIK